MSVKWMGTITSALKGNDEEQLGSDIRDVLEET